MSVTKTRIMYIERGGFGHRREASASVRRAVVPSVALVVGLALAAWWVSLTPEVPMDLDVVRLVIVLGLAMDVTAEAKAIRQHGDLLVIAELRRLDDATRAAAALRALGVPFVLRSGYVRALLQVFGPHLTLRVLVPGSRAEEAAARVRAVLEA